MINRTVSHFLSALVAGDSVYYAGTRLNKADLTQINGEYNPREGVLSASGSYVYTNMALYDRDRYVQLAQLPVDTMMLLGDSQGSYYYYDDSTQTIHKETPPLTLPTLTPEAAGLTD